MNNMFSKKYLDLKIRKEYLWGMIKTRRLVKGFDVSADWLIAKNLHRDFPTWKPFRVITQVRLFGFILFALPEWLDNILLENGFHDHRKEQDAIAHWLGMNNPQTSLMIDSEST